MNVIPLSRRPPFVGEDVSRKTRELLQQGSATIEMPKGFLAKHVPIILDGMRRMTDDPELHKVFAATVIGHDEAGNDYDAGLWHKIGDSGDIKHFFHDWSIDHPLREHWMQQPSFEAFFASCEAVGALSKEIILSFARAIDELDRSKGNYCGLAEAVTRGSWVLRCLRYPPRMDALPDAKVHFDRAFGTVHLYGSDQGLMIFDREYHPHLAHSETSFNLANVMLGKKFAAITNGRYGLGTLHGVRRKDRTSEKNIDDRSVLVVFIHGVLTTKQAEILSGFESNFESVARTYANSI